MEIKQVDITYLDAVFKIYRGCAKYHAEKGFFQWDENYPTVEIVKTDINNGQLFGLFDNQICMGVIALTHDEPSEYSQLHWSDSRGKYIIVHRLCIDINQMRKGYAKLIMDFSEKWAIENGYSSIRLDTFSPNKGAVSFYSNLGYTFKGEVFFEKRKDHGYSCFEKVL